MKAIGENQELIDNCRILDAIIKKVSIYDENYSVMIELDVAFYGALKMVRLIFEDVKEYCFFNKGCEVDQVIVHLSFFMKDDMVYISLDPVHASLSEIDPEDNFYIISKTVIGYELCSH